MNVGRYLCISILVLALRIGGLYTGEKSFLDYGMLRSHVSNDPAKNSADTYFLEPQPTITVAMSYFGTQAAAQPVIDEFVAIGPTRWENKTIPWSDLSKLQNFGASGTEGCTKGVWTNHYTVGANRTDAATYAKVFNEFATFASSRPWYNGFMSIQRTDTKVTLAVPKSKQGVYPGREIGTFM